MGRRTGLAAAYVWDVVSGGGLSEAILHSTADYMRLGAGGSAGIEARVLRTRRTFDDFEDYWSTTIAARNLAPMLITMASAGVRELNSRVREHVPIEESGRRPG